MKISFSPPDISEAEVQQAAEALRSGWITTGPKTKELERKVADFCGANRAVCLGSQTACAEMTLRLLGISEGDEVITCAYTYTATASVVCHVGAKLVLIDTQKDSLQMDYEQLADAITEKTKVIIPIDLGGVPCDYERIFSIVEDKKHLFHPSNKIQEAIGRVVVMADAAHAFGAKWHGKPVGSIADFSNFSFHAVNFFETENLYSNMYKNRAVSTGFEDEFCLFYTKNFRLKERLFREKWIVENSQKVSKESSTYLCSYSKFFRLKETRHNGIEVEASQRWVVPIDEMQERQVAPIDEMKP